MSEEPVLKKRSMMFWWQMLTQAHRLQTRADREMVVRSQQDFIPKGSRRSTQLGDLWEIRYATKNTKLKDMCSLAEKHIKRQRSYFADKGPSS